MPRSRAGMRSNVALVTILLTSVTSTAAISLPSLWSSGPAAQSLGLQKRAQKDIQIPAPINVSPSQYWDGNDGPWSSFALQVGTQAQNVRALISTVGTSTWTIGAGGCPPNYVDNCADKRGSLFFPNESLTWTPNSKYEVGVEKNLPGLNPSAPSGYDTVTLGWQGGGVTPTVNHSVVFNLQGSEYWIGEFGINPHPTNFTNFVDPQPSFMHQLHSFNQTPSLAYGYTAGNQYRLNKVYGSLVLGGYDENRFTPTDTIFTFNSDISRDLLVNVHAITTDKGTTTNLLPDGSISMFIDSTIPEIWLPKSACTAFENAFGLVYDDNFNHYTINDTHHKTLVSQNASVRFTLGNETTGGSTVDIVLPYGAFDLQLNYPIVTDPNTTYYFPLQRASNDSQYTLGRTFLQEAYLIADYDRSNFTVAPCLWDSTKTNTPSIKSIVSPDLQKQIDGNGGKGSSGISGGAIAGIVIAIVAVIGILLAALFFFRRRKNAQKKRVAELEAKEAGGYGKEGPTDDSRGDQSQSSASHPGGGELGEENAIHELNPHSTLPAQELDSPYKMENPSKHGFNEMDGGEAMGTGKGWAAEMSGQSPIYEMPGSDVTEMPAIEAKRATKEAEEKS